MSTYEPTINSNYLSVLRTLCRRLDDGGVTWAITGSLGFALHGMPVDPDDVDVQTDEAGAYEIARRFAAAVTRPVTYSATARIRSHFGALVIDGITVEIMGALQKKRLDGSWEPPVEVATHRRFISVAELCVPVLTLEYEVHAYRLLGRIERAREIQAWLRQSDTSS